MKSNWFTKKFEVFLQLKLFSNLSGSSVEGRLLRLEGALTMSGNIVITGIGLNRRLIENNG